MKLNAYSFDHVKLKAAFIWRISKLANAIQANKDSKFKEGFDEQMLDRHADLQRAQGDIEAFEVEHPSKMESVGLGHLLLPTVFDAKEVNSKILVASSGLKFSICKDIKDFAATIKLQS